MLETLRKHVKTAAVAVVFGLVIIAFAVTGGTGAMQDALKGASNASVIIAGGRTVSPADFKRNVENEIPALEQRYQRQISLEDIAKSKVDQQILQQTAAQESMSALIQKIGIKPGAQLVANQLREISAFFDPLTGKFDRKAYTGRLQQAGLEPKTFERGLSDEIASRHFGAGMEAGVRAPLTYAAFQAAFAKDNRSISLFAIDPSKVAASPAPTDAQLTALMNEFADRLRIPELRQLTIVRFSAKQAAATAPVDQAEVEKLYNFRKEQESTPETRTVLQVPAKDEAAAQAIAGRLAKGEDAAAVAKSVGAQLISYDGKPKTAIPDRKVSDIAFSLPAGQVSGPIKGDLGYAVVKVLNITPGKEVDLASMKTKLENEVRQNAAEQLVTEQADKFQTLHDAGATLADAASKSGGQVFVTAPIVAQGMGLDRKPALGVTPKLLTSAFKLTQGGESDIESESRGEYYVVKVEKIIPPSLPPLAEMRPNLTKAWVERDLATKLKAKADELAARIRKGEALTAVAASIGATVEKAGPIDRSNARDFARLGELLGGVLVGKKGEVVVGPASAPDAKTAPKPEMLIAQVDAAGVAPAIELAQMSAQARAQFTQLLTSDMAEQAKTAARDVVKPKVYPDRARKALGVNTPLEDETKAKDKGKKG